ncbi:hypothetical protein NHQ30_009601 [Ciborinia camelliae]|nr:hypothetical protein NHQ30_009601 [Ciborinia camelliae]
MANDNIRQGCWELYYAMSNDDIHGNKSIKLSKMDSPPHIRHCIDLLRQSLMCNADTTLELTEPDVNGVHGFGVPVQH